MTQVRSEDTSWWHVHPEYGQRLGSIQSQAARAAAAELVQHQTATSGVVTGYDQDGLIIEGPGFTGLMWNRHMHFIWGGCNVWP